MADKKYSEMTAKQQEKARLKGNRELAKSIKLTARGKGRLYPGPS